MIVEAATDALDSSCGTFQERATPTSKRSSTERQLTVCIAEDRPSCEPGLRLLLQSLARVEPGCAVTLFCPFAEEKLIRFTGELADLLVDVRNFRPSGAYMWNVKAQALLEALNDGAEEALWIDSDIIVSSPFASRISALGKNPIIVAEEALSGGADDNNALRARLWGFKVGRRFPFTLNTAILRVTRAHIPLLERWRSFLVSQPYKEEQAKTWNTRRVHMVGDQDVLTALLCSQEFCHIPVEIFLRASGIIQYFGFYGFTTPERVRCLIHGLPPFVHSQGAKAWIPLERSGSRSLRDLLTEVYQDASPYIVLAASWWPTETSSWTRPRSHFSRVLRAVGFGNPALTGLPIALIIDIARVTLSFARAFSFRNLHIWVDKVIELFSIRQRRI